MNFSQGPNGIQHSQLFLSNQEVNLFPEYEVIERKGKGHPDTIADTLASLISREYAIYTINNCEGFILHHQIDKLMIIGGKTRVWWGGGEFISPIKVIVAGRATITFKDKTIPIDDIVRTTIKNYFVDNFPLINFQKDVVIQLELSQAPGPGTLIESNGSIKNMFNPQNSTEIRGYESLVANDTSFCVGYYPLTELEKSVLEIESILNSKDLKNQYLWLGSDIKVMAVRRLKHLDITVCVPQIASFVPQKDNYILNINIIGQIIWEYLENNFDNSYDFNLSINTKDDYEKGNYYLTVSGASLSGDIGVVGRGNRVNGLICLNRPMSLEGVSGKNPRYYSGFIYSLFSKTLSKHLFDNFSVPNEVAIISQNGGPLRRPWHIIVKGMFIDEREIRNFIYNECDNIEKLTNEFIKGQLSTC